MSLSGRQLKVQIPNKSDQPVDRKDETGHGVNGFPLNVLSETDIRTFEYPQGEHRGHQHIS